MSDHGVSMSAVARHLDRSLNYVSGRLTGKHALSMDIIEAAAAVAHVGEVAFMANEVIIR